MGWISNFRFKPMRLNTFTNTVIMINMVFYERFKCLRCGHTWLPRILTKPKACPNCKSRAWDKAKK